MNICHWLRHKSFGLGTLWRNLTGVERQNLNLLDGGGAGGWLQDGFSVREVGRWLQGSPSVISRLRQLFLATPRVADRNGLVGQSQQNKARLLRHHTGSGGVKVHRQYHQEAVEELHKHHLSTQTMKYAHHTVVVQTVCIPGCVDGWQYSPLPEYGLWWTSCAKLGLRQGGGSPLDQIWTQLRTVGTCWNAIWAENIHHPRRYNSSLASFKWWGRPPPRRIWEGWWS